MTTHLPPSSPVNLPVVRTQEDLHRMWCALMGPLGFRGRSVWLTVIDAEGHPNPLAVQIEDLPRLPEAGDVDGFAHLLNHLASSESDGDSVAFLLTGPGRGGITPADRSWARALGEAVRRTAWRAWPVHWANDVVLRVVAPDDLAA